MQQQQQAEQAGAPQRRTLEVHIRQLGGATLAQLAQLDAVPYARTLADPDVLVYAYWEQDRATGDRRRATEDQGPAEAPAQAVPVPPSVVPDA